MLELTSMERSTLRSTAHSLQPIVIIGEAGLTPSVLKEIDMSLNAHGLIKVRVSGDDRETRLNIYKIICTQLSAAPIQHIGKLLVIYRPRKEAIKELNSNKGKGLREVMIVKPSRTGNKRPTVSKVIIKGNERVTAGGNIKRVKSRQVSLKKSHSISKSK